MALTPDEKEVLPLFLKQMGVIRRCRFFRKRRKPIQVCTNIKPGKGLTSQIRNLQMDDWRSALVSLRQFHAQGERINFNRVCSLLEKAGLDDSALLWIKAARRKWRRMLNSCPSHYFIDDKPRIVADAIDLFFNAVVFHTDADKARKSAELKWLQRTCNQ